MGHGYGHGYGYGHHDDYYYDSYYGFGFGLSLGYGNYPLYHPHYYASYYPSYYPYYYASYYPYYGSYGASAYAPVVYIESQETLYTDEDDVTNETATLQTPADGVDIGVAPDNDGRAFPEGMGAPRPLIEPQEAPEVLPPSVDGGETSSRLDDDGEERGVSESHNQSTETGVRT